MDNHLSVIFISFYCFQVYYLSYWQRAIIGKALHDILKIFELLSKVLPRIQIF